MDVSFSLRQVTALIDGPLYRVTNEITASVNASPAVFVFNTSTQAFSHYATPADLDRWPDSRALALQDGKMYYRLSLVTRDWKSVEHLNADIAMTKTRVQLLASELNDIVDSLVLDQTTVIEGE